MMKKGILSGFLIYALMFGNAQSNISTPEDREALFNYIIEKTWEREAWSPVKEEILGKDPRKNMLSLRDDIINASSDTDLYYALQRLSAARFDRHLSISEIEGGLVLPEIPAGQAPIRFHPDYSDRNNYFLFVSDYGVNIDRYVNSGPPVEIGDKLIEINNESFNKYLDKVHVYTRYSNIENIWRRVAFDLSGKSTLLPPSFYQERLKLLLEKKNGSRYEIDLPYLKNVTWAFGRVLRTYPGFEEVKTFQYESFKLYRPSDTKIKILLIWLYGFRGDLPEATDALVAWAEKNNMLDYDLIIDAIDARGGSQGAYALSRLTSKPFKTTGGNLKLSDITDDFIARYTARYTARQHAMDGSGREAQDDGTWVMEWLHGPVLKGLAAGQEYSNNVPFKCAHLPHYSDWIMQPHEKTFTGRLVLFLGPWGGSHLSQFASMVIDNGLGYTLGMPDGGYSNTWEWEEDLIFPISKKPVVRFMWSIGHTIRPNGQILEGNPAMVDELVPVTRDNYLQYKVLLLERALDRLKEEKFQKTR